MRRLSNGSNYLGAFVDEGDNELDMVSETPQSRRTSASSRRRSTFSVRSAADSTRNQPQSMAEQNRIAEMYKVVIKLSAENKINMKNSWSFDLIDQMGKLIRDEGKGGVNFQKASCTLDASIKIYSHRVDDTHASSHRILECLSRGDGEIDDENDDGDDNHTASAKPAKLGSKATSRRLNIESTIEKNVENLNQVAVERSHATDPSFFKLSKAFDEGGARGMLMNNLRVDSNTSTLCFRKETDFQSNPPLVGLTHRASPDPPHQTDLTVTEYSTASSVFAEFNLSELISKIGIDTRSLLQMKICNDLDDYRDVLGIQTVDSKEAFSVFKSVSVLESVVDLAPYQSLKFNDHRTVLKSDDIGQTAESTRDMLECNNYNPSSADVEAHLEDDNDDGGYYGGVSDDDGNDNHNLTQQESIHHNSDHSESEAVTLTGAATEREACQEAQNTARESLFVSANSYPSIPVGDVATPTTMYEEETIPMRQIDIVPLQNDYSYFNIAEMMNKQNAWAGAKHWKFGGRLRSAVVNASATDKSVAENDDEGEVIKAAVKTQKNRKKTSRSKDSDFFDFTSEIPSRDSFGIAKKGKANTIFLTAISQEKQTQSALQGVYDLPPDANLEVKDLCRLFLSPSLIVPPTRTGYGKVFTSKFIGESKATVSSNERIWGAPTTNTIQKVFKNRSGKVNTIATASLEMNSYDDYSNDDCGGDDDYGGDYCIGSKDNTTCSPASMAIATEASNWDTKLEINSNYLLKATRVVDKVVVGYATTSTKVNVRKLKTDIWDHIHRSVHSLGANSEINSSTKVTTAPCVSLGIENIPPAAGTKEDLSEDIDPLISKPLAINTTAAPLSFKSLIAAVDHQQEQTNVSLPYYFICLLHLANERTLEIKGTEKLDDLFITGSQC